MTEKQHLNYLRRKTADESELWAADRIEQLEHNYASLSQAFEEMKTLAAQRLEALQETERQRDELKADAERYRWLRDRFFGADFDWNEEGVSCVLFKWPETAKIGANIDVAIDAAIAAARKEKVDG